MHMLAFTRQLAVHILRVGVFRVIIVHWMNRIASAVSEYLLHVDELA